MLLKPTLQMNSFFSESYEYLESLDKKYIKSNGIAYTPQWIAKHITTTAFYQWSKFNAGKTPSSASDLCCGTGVFINELISVVEGSSLDTVISGYDIDDGAIKKANKFFGCHSSVIEIGKRNTLLSVDSLFESDDNKYDIIVGNPPYVSHKLLDDEYKKFLSKNYNAAASGAFDLSVVFAEKVLKSLKQGGVASLILSNKFMSSKYGKLICELLSTKCNIIKIEDFNDIQLFKGLTTYTCIITFIKSKPAKKHTLAKAAYETKNNVDSMPRMINETINHEELLKHPWNFHTKEDALIHKKMNSISSSVHIYDIFDEIQQGIRTGANDVFIIDEALKNQFNSKLIKTFVSGENVVGLKVKNTKQYIIYPYKFHGGLPVSISESELKSQHKNLYEYLHNKKKVLSTRSLQGNTNWYEFSRSQSLTSANQPKIFVREMMPTAIFAADLEGEYVFSSGYGLIARSMNKIELLAWTAILSTPTMEFSMRHVGTQLHSGWFRLMKNHLNNLRLPKISKSDFKKIKDLLKDDNCNFEQIDKIVGNAFGLEKNEIEYIQETLSKIHEKSRPSDKNLEKVNSSKYEPVKLKKYNIRHVERDDLRQAVTFSQNKKYPIHNWYKYTQGFSPVLVNTLLDEFNAYNKSKVLDPFSGCGTTVVTCAYRGIDSIGIEISPLMHLVAKIKSKKWNLKKIRDSLNYKTVKTIKTRDLVFKEYFEKAYSSNILESLQCLLSFIKDIEDEEVKDFYIIGILSILEEVSKIRKHGSHYRFLDKASSVGLQKLNIDVIDENADIENIFKAKLKKIYEDICTTGGNPKGKVKLINGSSLQTSLKKETIDIIITSPPYLNRNNYIAQQKAELDMLGMITSRVEYKALVKNTFRSHTDSKLCNDPTSRHDEVNKIIANIELEEGNNPKIPHMICGYFDDLEDSLQECYRLLKLGGKASFVVGNTRWGGVIVPIDHILAKFAEDIGFNVDSIYVTRLKGNSPQQMKRFGKIPVRESIVNLTKN